MHTDSFDRLSHSHAFNLDSRRAERVTLYVVWLTAVTMVVEIAAGYAYGSMALLADGWHMGTHVAALSIAVFAYRYARAHAHDRNFSFGTGKVGALGGFASAIGLMVVAVMMGLESVQRLASPVVVRFDEALVVAGFGLAINLLSAWLLAAGHDHDHHHDHGSDHDHHHHADAKDHNLRAAYMHVLADALTSVLAIVALVLGGLYGWVWLDPLMGLVGALVIGRWSIGLIRETGSPLLDRIPDGDLATGIRAVVEADADNRVVDLHLWSVGPGRHALILGLVTDRPRAPDHYKALLADQRSLAHVTIEVNPCDDPNCPLDGSQPSTGPELVR